MTSDVFCGAAQCFSCVVFPVLSLGIKPFLRPLLSCWETSMHESGAPQEKVTGAGLVNLCASTFVRLFVCLYVCPSTLPFVRTNRHAGDCGCSKQDQPRHSNGRLALSLPLCRSWRRHPPRDPALPERPLLSLQNVGHGQAPGTFSAGVAQQAASRQCKARSSRRHSPSDGVSPLRRAEHVGGAYGTCRDSFEWVGAVWLDALSDGCRWYSTLAH